MPETGFPENPARTNREIAAAWESFVAGGEFAGGSPRPVIARGWQRCRQLGISPVSARAPTRFTVEEIEAILANHALGLAGKDVLQIYRRLVDGTGHAIVLADAHGRILYSVGSKDTRIRLERINFMPGGVWSEEVVGPNGIGTPLVLGRPELVFGTEHYCQGWQPWVCYGSPVRDPGSGEVIGAIDISGLARDAHAETMALTIAIAQAVEHRLQITELRRRDALRTRWRDFERRWPNDGLLLISDAGRIIDANAAALRHLDLESTPIRDRLLAEVNAALWDRVRYLGPVAGEVILERKGGPGGGLRLRVEPISENGARLGRLIVVTAPSASAPRPSGNRRNPAGTTAKYAFDDLIGQAPAFSKALALARTAARDPRENTVLLTGESGTGKELVAHAIHAASRRAHRPMVIINCGALPAELAESELFGHGAGAFTGARRHGAIGKFEAADGGTLFIDEVDSLPLALQAKFLRTLEDGDITRVGEVRSIHVNVRVIAAAGTQMRQRVEAGEFRSDLFHRLSVIEIGLPALQERREDIVPLARHFLARYCAEAGRGALAITPEALGCLLEHAWPGNVRELRNLCARWALMVKSDGVGVDDIPPHLRCAPAIAADAPVRRLREIEDDMIRRALEECGGRISEAARRLGVDRVTIYRRRRRWEQH